MLTIDGRVGEGGGQILRSSLALSCITRRAMKLVNIRANRSKPGLRPQHLACVRAAAQISGAKVRGDAVNSRELEFRPKKVRSGDFGFQVGTAGSAALVLQTVLLPLALHGDRRSTVRIGGGTHNDKAPPVTFLQRAWLPRLHAMGLDVEVELERPGFYPKGGGSLVCSVRPSRPKRLELSKRGQKQAIRAHVVMSGLPRAAAEEALSALRCQLSLDHEDVQDFRGPPGLAVMVEVESRNVTELFGGLANRGRNIEGAATGAACAALAYLAQPEPVGEHLADQLMLPMALGEGGAFRSVPPSLHTTTNADIIRRFLDVDITFRDGEVRIEPDA